MTPLSAALLRRFLLPLLPLPLPSCRPAALLTLFVVRVAASATSAVSTAAMATAVAASDLAMDAAASSTAYVTAVPLVPFIRCCRLAIDRLGLWCRRVVPLYRCCLGEPVSYVPCPALVSLVPSAALNTLVPPFPARAAATTLASPATVPLCFFCLFACPVSPCGVRCPSATYAAIAVSLEPVGPCCRLAVPSYHGVVWGA